MDEKQETLADHAFLHETKVERWDEESMTLECR
jgi:hypothetical protein